MEGAAAGGGLLCIFSSVCELCTSFERRQRDIGDSFRWPPAAGCMTGAIGHEATPAGDQHNQMMFTPREKSHVSFVAVQYFGFRHTQVAITCTLASFGFAL